MAITHFKHRRLRRFFRKRDRRGIPPQDAERLRQILTLLDTMTRLQDLRAFHISLAPHELAGDRQGTWSLRVRKNWRVTFRIDEDGNVTNVDLEDYH